MKQSRQIYLQFRKLENFFKNILKFKRPSPNSTSNWFNTKGINYLTVLHLGLSHPRNHQFKHDLLDSLNPICSCGFDIETKCHFLIHCPNFINERSPLLKNVSWLNKNKLPFCDNLVMKRLLYGDNSFDLVANTLMLNLSVDFILSSERFDGPLI